jgi:hypothetical protein
MTDELHTPSSSMVLCPPALREELHRQIAKAEHVGLVYANSETGTFLVHGAKEVSERCLN